MRGMRCTNTAMPRCCTSWRRPFSEYKRSSDPISIAIHFPRRTTMTMKEFFLAQLEREATSTRKAVERVPEGRNSFKPHERSMELGYLAALVAGMIGWIALMIDRDELDLDKAESE